MWLAQLLLGSVQGCYASHCCCAFHIWVPTNQVLPVFYWLPADPGIFLSAATVLLGFATLTILEHVLFWCQIQRFQ